MHLAVYSGLRSKKNRKPRRSRTVEKAEKQRSRKAKKQRTREAGKGRKAENKKQRSRIKEKAEKQKAEKQKSKEAGKKKSKKCPKRNKKIALHGKTTRPQLNAADPTLVLETADWGAGENDSTILVWVAVLSGVQNCLEWLDWKNGDASSTLT